MSIKQQEILERSYPIAIPKRDDGNTTRSMTSPGFICIVNRFTL